VQLHIRGKGGRDRFVRLPEGALLMLREFWKTHRSPILFFPATTRKGLKHSLATDAGPIHRSGLQGAFRRARDKAGIRKRAHIHTLRLRRTEPQLTRLNPQGPRTPRRKPGGVRSTRGDVAAARDINPYSLG